MTLNCEEEAAVSAEERGRARGAKKERGERGGNSYSDCTELHQPSIWRLHDT